MCFFFLRIPPNAPDYDEKVIYLLFYITKPGTGICKRVNTFLHRISISDREWYKVCGLPSSEEISVVLDEAKTCHILRNISLFGEQNDLANWTNQSYINYNEDLKTIDIKSHSRQWNVVNK